MVFSAGWCKVRSSQDPYVRLAETHTPETDEFYDAVEATDSQVRAADSDLFDALIVMLKEEDPNLSWDFRRELNNETGLLSFTHSTNHRGQIPATVAVLHWLAENGPDSYGIVYLKDDEDEGDSGRARGRDGTDHSNEFRVWRLLRGKVEEFADPFLSPIIPTIDDFDY